MVDAIIFDIDGTLADCSHRVHHVKNGKKDWDKFFAAMDKDTPVPGVVWLAEVIGCAEYSATYNMTIGDKFGIFIVSARPDNYRSVTEEWLRVNCPILLGSSTELLMREEGDHRPDTEVKRDILKNIQGQGYDVKLVIDDRPSVLQMWKDEGIPVLQVPNPAWEVSKFEPGKLVLMIGPSGAGKTTYTKRQVREGEWLDQDVISSDDIRMQLNGNITDQSKNGQVFAILYALVKARIENGLNVVVDATNLRNRDRRTIRDLVSSDTPITYIVIDRLLEHKIADGGWRNEVIIGDQTLIEKHHQIFKSNLKAILAGDSDPRITVRDTRVD